MLIYKAVNKIDKKIYIGKTIKTLKQRKACYNKKYKCKCKYKETD